MCDFSLIVLLYEYMCNRSTSIKPLFTFNSVHHQGEAIRLQDQVTIWVNIDLVHKFHFSNPPHPKSLQTELGLSHPFVVPIRLIVKTLHSKSK